MKLSKGNSVRNCRINYFGHSQNLMSQKTVRFFNPFAFINVLRLCQIFADLNKCIRKRSAEPCETKNIILSHFSVNLARMSGKQFYLCDTFDILSIWFYHNLSLLKKLPIYCHQELFRTWIDFLQVWIDYSYRTVRW